jgi:hypothetical protein
MEKIYEKLGFVVVSYNPTKNFIVFDWTRYFVTLEEIKELHTKALEFARIKGVKTFVADTVKVKDVFLEECTDWFAKVQIPRLSEAGIKRIVTITPETALGRLSTKTWQAKISGIELYSVPNGGNFMSLVV